MTARMKKYIRHRDTLAYLIFFRLENKYSCNNLSFKIHFC